MDAVTYIKEVIRMCESCRHDCDGCPTYDEGFCPFSLNDMSKRDAEKTVSSIEQWAKDHPIKTRQSEFLKIFPKAGIKGDALWMCPKYISYDYRPEKNCYEISCDDCKRKFWNEEVTDND